MALGRAILKLQSARLARGIGGGFARGLQGSRRGRNFGAFIQVDDAQIRYFPAECFHISLLLVALFEENGFPGVGAQIAGRGQDDIPGPVGYLNPSSQQS